MKNRDDLGAINQGFQYWLIWPHLDTLMDSGELSRIVENRPPPKFHPAFSPLIFLPAAVGQLR